MDRCLWHGFSSCRQCRRTTMLIYISILALFFDNVSCAAISSTSEKTSLEDFAKNENNTFSRRQLLPVNVVNPYLHTQSFGFPFYQHLGNNQQILSSSPHLAITSSGSNKPVSVQPQKKTAQIKKTEDTNEYPSKGDKVANTSEEKTAKSKNKKEKRKKEKVQEGGNAMETVESKTIGDDGTERGCPACVDGSCDSFLDSNTNISGIPVIQIIAALAIGAAWAAIFAFIIHNFIEYKKGGEEEEGYGYGPSAMPEYGAPTGQYGAPQSEYGAPATGYSSNSNSYRKSYGRSSQGYSFNDMSNWVWSAIDKLATKYENESSD